VTGRTVCRHSSCRLCTFLADEHRRKVKADKPLTRPCTCRDGATGTHTHHLFFRERGRFHFRSVFLPEPLTVRDTKLMDTLTWPLLGVRVLSREGCLASFLLPEVHLAGAEPARGGG
jgi:hypothetical protein